MSKFLYARTTTVAVVASLVLFIPGCGGGGPAGPSGPNYSGTWTGKVLADKTIERGQITFLVSGQDITTFTANLVVTYIVRISSNTFGLRFCNDVLTASGPVRINGANIVVPVRSSISSTVFRGSFTSETAASGTVDSFTLVRGCGSDVIFGTSGGQEQKDWNASR